MSKTGFFLIIFFAFGFFGCSKFQRLQKSESLVEKYDGAIKYYTDGDFYRAGLLLEELIPLLRGKAEAEQAEFYYAYCQYYQRQLLLAAYYFRKFNATYPRSEFAEEAMYMQCRSLYEMAPSNNLDQSNSEEALESIQSFIRRYPSSKYMDQINAYSAALNEKILMKNYTNAELYFKLRRYKSAVVALENYRIDYPDSPHLEQASFMKFKSQYEFARRSVKNKQLERFYEAIDYYRNFVDRFPNSVFVKDAENIYENCINRISSLKNSKG